MQQDQLPPVFAWDVTCSAGLPEGTAPTKVTALSWNVTDDTSTFSVAENLRAVPPGSERYDKAPGWRRAIENDQVADREFPATPAGYRRCWAGWAGTAGSSGWGWRAPAPTAPGWPGTCAGGVTLVEVDRPDRKTRRAKGRSDPIDAYAAARAALNGSASGTPKTRDGRVEAIRALRVARRGASKATSYATSAALRSPTRQQKRIFPRRVDSP